MLPQISGKGFEATSRRMCGSDRATQRRSVGPIQKEQGSEALTFPLALSHSDLVVLRTAIGTENATANDFFD
jgi:hypothetical protein